LLGEKEPSVCVVHQSEADGWLELMVGWSCFLTDVINR